MINANSDSPGLTWLAFAFLTVVSWGVYGVFLHTGQVAMQDPVNGRYKAFLFVGIAYFLTAVLAPLALLLMKGAAFSGYTQGGMGWSLFAALVPANSFYTRKFSRAGLTATVTSLAEFAEKFPFTSKQELADDQCAQPPYGTNLTFPLERYTRFHQTSGTTGAPLRWLDTPESWNWMVENWTEIFCAAGATSGERVFFAFSFGPFIGFWLAYEAAQRIGCLCLPGGGLSSAARLRVMMENDATVLCCTPTYALRLAEVAAEEKIDLHAARVRSIIVAGEPGGSIPALRARLQELWQGARIFDHHGMTETGPVTHECPKQPGVLHVLEPAYYAEVIDPVSAKPVAPGQRGELVLTTLGRTGSPLLRYRTGDLVQPVPQPST